MKLDDLLKDSLVVAAPSGRSLDRIRAAARAEVRVSRPLPRWPAQAVKLAGAVLGSAGVAAIAVLLAGATTPAFLVGRLPTLALLTVTAVVTAIAALRPRALLGLVVVPLAAAAGIVLLRGTGVSSTSPEWLCTVNHLGAGVLPLAVAVVQLRVSAFDAKRALLAGLTAGCVGALLGELACGQGAQHVLAYHLPAWAVVTVATVLISRQLTPKSYAP